jgi:hypothetical protein
LNRPNSEAEFQKQERQRLREQYPTLVAYLDRIEAKTTLNFRSHVVREKDEDNRYWRDRVQIKIERDGEVKVEPAYLLKDEVELDEFEPTEEEREAIRAEVAAKPFPTAIPFSSDDLAQNSYLVGVDPSELYPCRDESGELFQMIQWRKEDDNGKSYWLTYSFWNDTNWRKMDPWFEPHGLLPLVGLERQFGKDRHEYARSKIMIHEGAKVQRRIYELLERGNHPWCEELSTYVHFSWVGGVHRVHQTNWGRIKKLDSGYLVTLALDNDVGGINAATEISRILQRSLTALKFDDRFPETFDLADDWPTKHKAWWQGKHYRGPRLDDFLFPATWATKALRNPSDKKKPIFKITDRFAAEWLWVASQDAFVNRQQPNVLHRRPTFNSRVRSFSDVEDTARVFDQYEAHKCDDLTYDPSTTVVVVNVGGKRLVNRYRPGNVRPIAGDETPFIKFMEHLFPSESDRKVVLRWVTTLVACPWVKMFYSLLLISVCQGVGKNTLGEILARLIGLHNASFPNEEAILRSQFNDWIANKRLIVVSEIYAGRGRKMYDALKPKITDEHIEVHEKYLKRYTIPNYAHFLALSNYHLAIHLDDNDRRWFVPEVTEDPRDKAYWDGFYAWLRGDGLAIIYGYLLKLAEDPANLVAIGERAPSSAAKEEIVTDSMSDGERIAFDFGGHVAELNTESDERPAKKPLHKIVLSVDDVRDYVATRLQIHREDSKLASPLAIRRALVRAGLKEPRLARGETRKRFKIEGRSAKSYVVANFEIEPGTKWEGIKDFYQNADQAARM